MLALILYPPLDYARLVEYVPTLELTEGHALFLWQVQSAQGWSVFQFVQTNGTNFVLME